MLRKLLGFLWRGAPQRARRWSMWLIEPRFMVTTGAVIVDERGRVLLLKHVFRSGHGWGLPGGFLEKGEQPENALRRELREEAGVELDDAEIALVRTFRRPQQVEILYRCRARTSIAAPPQSMEIDSVAWFEANALPPGLTKDQRRLIARVLKTGAHAPD